MSMKFTDIVPEHDSWHIIDSTKLRTYMECPRKYFYTYVLGWRSKFPNNHLFFGTLWHEAVEFLLDKGYTRENLIGVKVNFYEKYREVFGEETDKDFGAKTPDNALMALDAYFERFQSDPYEYTVIATEIGGIVNIGPRESMAYKMDAVLKHKHESAFTCLDFKTSQRMMSYWADSWSLDNQMLLYLHALYCLYGGMKHIKKTVRIRGAFFYTSKPALFKEARVEKELHQFQSWLATILTWYRTLKLDMKILLEDDREDKEVMEAFPMNSNACFNWGRECEFHNLCISRNNPLQACAEPPVKLKVEFWNPLEDREIKRRIDIKGPLEVANGEHSEGDTL